MIVLASTSSVTDSIPFRQTFSLLPSRWTTALRGNNRCKFASDIQFWINTHSDTTLGCVWHTVHFVTSTLEVNVPTHLDLLSGDCLQLSLLSNGEAVDQDLRAGGDSHLEVVTILLNLGDAFDVFAFLDELIRKTLKIGSRLKSLKKNLKKMSCIFYTQLYMLAPHIWTKESSYFVWLYKRFYI